MKIALTGHRPQRLFGEDLENENWTKIRKWLKETLIENNCSLAISGMAAGSDMLFALAVKDLKEQGENIKLELAFPCHGYGRKSSYNKYLQWRQEIIQSADKKTFIHEKWCKTADDDRDKYMVENCDILIAIFDGNNVGGVYHTIQHAKRLGKKIIYCPKELVQK